MNSYSLLFPVVIRENSKVFGVRLWNELREDGHSIWNAIDENQTKIELDYSEPTYHDQGNILCYLYSNLLRNRKNLIINFERTDSVDEPFTKKCPTLNFSTLSASLAVYLATIGEFSRNYDSSKLLIVSCAMNIEAGFPVPEPLNVKKSLVEKDFTAKLKFISAYKNKHPIVLFHQKDIEDFTIPELEKLTELKVYPKTDAFESKEVFDGLTKTYDIFGVTAENIDKIAAALDLVDPCMDFSDLESLDTGLFPKAVVVFDKLIYETYNETYVTENEKKRARIQLIK